MTPSSGSTTENPAASGSAVRDVIALIVSLAVCFGVAAVGSAFTTPSLPGWYAGIAKPEWTPPNAVFAPVWTTLFALMAIAAWLVWRRQHEKPARVRLALVMFGVQLLLNMGWSLLFFRMRAPGWAMVEIVVLWVAIYGTFWAFRRVTSLAALLLVPYFFWVAFAAALNFSIWRLNG